MKSRRLLLGILTAALAATAGASAGAEDEGFPLRAIYPDVPCISTGDLLASFDDVLIVDVRSEFEYDVIHLTGALSSPVAKSTFDRSLADLTKRDRSARLVFYCNGHTCAKSYKATRRALELGYAKAVAYDAGVFDWTRAHPERAVLLGKSPADPKDLLSSDKLARHELDAKAFIAGARSDSAILIDARDPIQRKKTPDFGGKQVRNYYMRRLAALLDSDGFREQTEGQTLYIFDAAGKQVRWLQYHLEEQGYESYYFLDGGVWSVFGAEGANDPVPASSSADR